MSKLHPHDIKISYAGAVAGEQNHFTFTLDYTLVEHPPRIPHPTPFHHHGNPRPEHHRPGHRHFPIACRELYVTKPGCKNNGFGLLVQVNGELEIHHVRKVAGNVNGRQISHTLDNVQGVLEQVNVVTDSDAECFNHSPLGQAFTESLLENFAKICHDDPRVLDAGAYRLKELDNSRIYNAMLNTTTIATITQDNWNLNLAITQDYKRYGLHREVEDDSVYYDAKRRIITPHYLTWLK